jgi:hypothetical protein
MSDDLRRGERVAVKMGAGAKYGMVTGESKDSWVVLIDGNKHASVVAKSKVTRLKPHQLAFHFGKVRSG